MSQVSLCPVCRQKNQASGCLPFCSPRCKSIDLARWLGGEYRVPGDPVTSDPHTREEEARVS